MRTVSEKLADNTADLARGAGSSYLGYLARLAVRAPYLFLAGWLYGSEKFGLYTFAVTIAETLAVVATFGFKNSIYKFLDEAEESRRPGDLHRALAHAFAPTLALGVFFSLTLAGVGVSLVASRRFATWAEPLVLISPVIPFIVLADIALVAIRHRRVVRYEVLARSIIEPMVMTSSIVVAYALGWRNHGLILAYVLSLIAAAASSVAFFRRFYSLRGCLTASLRREPLRRMLRFSAPTALFQFLRFLSARVDILMVSGFFSPAVVGVYGMAWQFSTIFKKIRQGFDTLLGPVISREVTRKNFDRVNHHLATVARWVLSIQMPLVLLAVFFGGRILGLVGAGFSHGVVILSLLVLGDVINGSLGVHEWPLVFLKPILNPIFLGLMMALNVGLGVLAGHWIGPAGIAAAGVVTYLAMNCARVGLNIHFFDLPGLRWDILKPLLASVVTALVLSLLSSWYRVGSWGRVGFSITLMLGVYVLVLALMGMNPEDRWILARVRRRLRRGLGRSPA